MDLAVPQMRSWALSIVLLGCSGGAGQSVDFPEIEEERPQEAGALVDGEGADLTGCRVESRSDAVLDLRCPEAALSEMRMPSQGKVESSLAVVIDSLKSRYGELEVKSSVATLDGATVDLRSFRGRGQPPVSGLVAALSNKERVFWAVACFREAADIDLAFCRRAIATIGRKGGASEVGAAALPPLDFDGAALELAPGCKQSGDTRIQCPGGELSWVRPDDRDISVVREESAERLRSMATQEGIQISEESPACKVRKAEGDCLKITLVDPNDQSVLVFLLAIADSSTGKMLTVCTYPGDPSSEPPPPCDQVLALTDTKPAG